MEKIVLTRKQLKSLKKYDIGSGIFNSEASFFLYDDDNLLKISKDYLMGNQELSFEKQENLEYLNSFSIANKIKELVIPDKLVTINNMVVGSSIKLIKDSKNLGTLLNNNSTPIKKKLDYLKEVGKILNDVQKLKDSFYFGDFHAYNFLIDSNSNIHVVDLDSIYRDGNKPRHTYYFSNYRTITNTINISHKYRYSKDERLFPTKDSDLLSYIYMVINTISRHNLHFLNKYDYSDYIKYLKELGYNDTLIEILKNIYGVRENTNLYMYLDNIDENILKKSAFFIYKNKQLRR